MNDIALVGLLAGVAGLMVFGFDWNRPSRAEWGNLNCARSHEERYAYRDDRPHGQGGRGGMLFVTVMVCDEKATIGAVMPNWARYNGPNT